MAALSEHLAFNTAASFTTNTNWQSYGGESTMSYLSQMLALAFHNYLSAAMGIAIAAVLVRGIARHSAKTLGNFWVDIHTDQLLPAAPDLFGFCDLPRLAGRHPELQTVSTRRRSSNRSTSRCQSLTTRASLSTARMESR